MVEHEASRSVFDDSLDDGGVKKKPKLSALKKKAWDLMSKIIRQHYADHRGMVECVTCGEVDDWKCMHAGHFIPKARGTSVYFEWRNVHPQCPRCNLFDQQNANRKYTIWMIDTYGRDEVERLEAMAHTGMKVTRAGYEEMIEFFRKCEAEL